MEKTMSALVSEIRQDKSDKFLSPLARCRSKMTRVLLAREQLDAIRRQPALARETSQADGRIFDREVDRDPLYVPVGTYPDSAYGDYLDPDPSSF